MSKLEMGERKQIYKQMHNVRKQPKPEHLEIGVEKMEHTALIKTQYNFTLIVLVDIHLSATAPGTGVYNEQ